MTAAGPMPTRAPAIWGNVPQRIKNFTGRTELLKELRPDENGDENRKVTGVLSGGPAPQALQGLPGVGKTALAVEYAHRYRHLYDLVWWIPSDELALVRASLASLAEQLDIKPVGPTGIEGSATAVLNALRRGDPYSRWLLIFDNADQPEELNEIIPRGPGDVIITSRNHRWKSVIDTVQVDVFTRTESTEFLSRRVPKGLSEPEADQLAEKLGDLPLALEQAGALQAETGMAVEEYLQLLDEHTSAIMAEGKSPEYPMSMTAAWRLSVSTLRQQLPAALELLRCCAFLGPDPIPQDVFRRGSKAGTSMVGDVISDPILLSRVIRELGRFALIRIEGRTFSVHRLIQALLRDELSLEDQARYRHEVHAILAAGAPRNPSDSRLWPSYAELVAHVVAPSTDIAHCTYESHRAFALDVIRYLYFSGDLASCRLFADRFHRQWAADSGPDDPTVLDARRHLGNALRELGAYAQAYDLNEDTLARSRVRLGEQDPLTLTLRNSVAADRRARGDFAAALQMDQEALDLHQKVFGPEDPQTLRVMNNLALDYGLNSNYWEARDLHQRTFIQQSNSAEVSPIHVLGSWMGLARAVRLCGNFMEARDAGEDARDFGRDRLGVEHYQTLRATNDLSIALRRIPQEVEQARDLAHEIYTLSTRVLGEKHPDTMAAAMSLINARRTLGEIDQAIELAESVMEIYPDVYGHDHPYNQGCIGNLAVLRRLSGDPAAARKLNETALAKLDARLSRDHFYSLTIAINLASDLAALGEVADALATGQNSLDRARRLFGETHPLSLACAANLVQDLRASGETGDADLLLAETMGFYDATLGLDHSEAQAAAAGVRLDPDFDPPPI